MVHRTFDNLKFKRTYIGGSKQRENETFSKVQGNKEDNSECDWLEYRRILTQYFDDQLNVILSWCLVLKNLSFALAIIAVIAMFINTYISFSILFISIIVRGLYVYLKKKESKKLFFYNYSLDVTLNEIKEQTGLELSKN